MGPNEAFKILRRANRLCAAPGRERHAGRRRVPPDRRQRSDVLTVEKEVRASGRQRVAPAAAAGARQWPAQAAGRRSDARQAHAVRGAEKKSRRPTRRRELAHWFQETFDVSCVRACRLAQLECLSTVPDLS